jgi:hypothetical protein
MLVSNTLLRDKIAFNWSSILEQKGVCVEIKLRIKTNHVNYFIYSYLNDGEKVDKSYKNRQNKYVDFFPPCRFTSLFFCLVKLFIRNEIENLLNISCLLILKHEIQTELGI